MLSEESLPRNKREVLDKPEVSSDRRLLNQMQEGEQDATAQLYARYGEVLYNYILRLIHDRTGAEDLLQETFLAAWKGAKSFRGRSSVKTWLFRIAHNQSVSWLRKHAGETLIDESNLPPVEMNYDQRLMVEWQADVIISALEKLSPNHRAVIELIFGQGLSYADVAEIMECPVGTVKSRVSYAIRQINLLVKTDL